MHVLNCWTLPLQQLSVALHWFVCKRQMSPFGLQPDGFAHTPTGSFAFALLQTPGGDGGLLLSGRPPQQSLSFVQMSPTGLQPLAG